MRLNQRSLWLVLILSLIIILWSQITLPHSQQVSLNPQSMTTTSSTLLSEPFLQLPTPNSINVVWFTDFPGEKHSVVYGDRLQQQVAASSTQLTLREDAQSRSKQNYLELTNRHIWRHEAVVRGLNSQQKLPYKVISHNQKSPIESKVYHLSSQPLPGTPLNILLTSDHQLMPMTAANMQQVRATIDRLDGVFLAGDLVNIPDRASEWFDDVRGGAFFPCLQGQASYELEKNGVKTVYRGGEIIQNAPLFTAVGNHEVMGKKSATKSLKEQFADAIPRDIAQQYYQSANSTDKSQESVTWIKDNSFNIDTYESIFSLPQSKAGGKKYYAVTFGDIRLVVLYVTNIWRSPSLAADVKGRYQERQADLTTPENWGYGQHIFEPITPDSEQYRWLETELASEAFQQAKYKIVMFHHPPHTLGGNIVPPYTNPQAEIAYNSDGTVQEVTYKYAIEDDYIIRDLIPLLETAGVQLVYYGHSHLWNRFSSPSGMHFLESSNVGNTYGAHVADNPRAIPPNSAYLALGNPNGLEPIVPNIDPLTNKQGESLPYIASDDITVFSILNTEKGTVSSYRFDTSQPDSKIVKFDEFSLAERN